MADHVITAVDFKDYADYVLFSEESIPFDGYPYNDFFGYLSDNLAASVEVIGSTFVDLYVDSYSGGSQGFSEYVTLSFIDTSYLGDLVAPTNALAT